MVLKNKLFLLIIWSFIVFHSSVYDRETCILISLLFTKTQYSSESIYSLNEYTETSDIPNNDVGTSNSDESKSENIEETVFELSEVTSVKSHKNNENKSELNEKQYNARHYKYNSPKQVELSIIKPFKLIKKPLVDKLDPNEFAFMVRPNERMLGIEKFVIDEIEQTNVLFFNISAGSSQLEGEGSIKNFKFQKYGHYSFPGLVEDEVVSEELYLRTIPFGRYVPLFIEVRSSAYNAALHGIYKREDSLQLTNKENRFSWYYEPINRPVFKRISSEPNLFIFFLNYPMERWCIGDTWPIENPKVNVGQIYAELIGRPYSPTYSRGWYVYPRKYGAHDIIPYIELDPSTPLRNPLPVEVPKGMENKRILVFDKDFIVDEARPFTFIPPESQIMEHVPLVESPDNTKVFSGCPNKYLNKFTGIVKYNTPTCIPPLRGVLDVVLNGANGYFQNAIYSWEGFFKNRPYFVQRGPLRNYEVTLQSSIVEYPGNSQYLWALEEGENAICWFISRQLGNTNPSQVLAVWRRPKESRIKSPIDWPAEKGIELEPDGWSFIKPPFKKKHFREIPIGDYYNEKIFVRINGLTPKHVKMVVSGGPEDVNGDYLHIGEYLGFPFFRQKRNKKKNHPGYVLFRGIVVSRSKDTWVIGSTLGSINGIRAYAVDYTDSSYSYEFAGRAGLNYLGGTRWPHQIPIKSWRIWAPVDDSIKINIYNKELRGRNSEEIAKNIEFFWRIYESLYITMEYLDPNKLFRQNLSPVLGFTLGTEKSVDQILNTYSVDISDVNNEPKSEESSTIEENKARDQIIVLNELNNDVLNPSFDEIEISFSDEAKSKEKGSIFIGIIGIAVSIVFGVVLWVIIKINCLKHTKEDNQDSILGDGNKIDNPRMVYYSRIS
ncbi:membrane associated protein [Cryptosporidium ryanae]|uniref:membrane associated protein n=1 Tax=Cryptosporidium ryanae TaxID=515981 RepID=UPI00351AAFE2|nr:membrane associated protein [Cryptosporidium ryanae]